MTEANVDQPPLTPEQISIKEHREKYGTKFGIAATVLSVTCFAALVGGQQEKNYPAAMWFFVFSLPPLAISCIHFWMIHEEVPFRHVPQWVTFLEAIGGTLCCCGLYSILWHNSHGWTVMFVIWTAIFILPVILPEVASDVVSLIRSSSRAKAERPASSL